MTTKLFITIIIAIIGWTFGFVELFLKRKWQNKDRLATMRQEAYSNFMKKMDAFGKDMNQIPQKMIGSMMSEFLSKILKDNADIEGALIKYNTQVSQLLQNSIEPLSAINQELSALKLVASEKVLVLIEQLKKLTEDLYNDYQIAFTKITPTDIETIKQMPSTIGYSERVRIFTSLYDELFKQMRDEIK